MSVPPAFLLIGLPFLVAPIVYLFRRIGVGAVIAALACSLLAWFTIQLPVGTLTVLLGRTIQLDYLSQAAIALLFASAAVLFLISMASVPLIGRLRERTVDPGALTGAGRTFYPLSLTILGFLAAAVMVRHLGISAVLVQFAVMITVFIIQGARLDSTRAAQRFLLLFSLATPLFLLAAAQLDQFIFSGEVQPTQTLRRTALLVGLGFALWLAVVPFHGWLTSTMREASPATASFVTIAFPTIALVIFIHLWVEVPWLITLSQLPWAIAVAGVVTACIGGALTSIQRGFGGLLGYAALYDLGCLLVLLSLSTGNSVGLYILSGLVVRILALTLIAAAVSALRLSITGDGLTQMAGMAYRMPLATTAVVVGGLTLAGVPFTVGFPVRLQMLEATASANPTWAVLLVLAGLGVTVGYLRAGQVLVARGQSGDGNVTINEPGLLIVIMVMLIVACVGLGVYPAQMIEALTPFAQDSFVLSP